jgi:hypothetical protein
MVQNFRRCQNVAQKDLFNISRSTNGERVMLPSVAGALDGRHHGVPWQLLQILQAQVQLLSQQTGSQRLCCGSGSVIICTDPDPSINKQKKVF